MPFPDPLARPLRGALLAAALIALPLLAFVPEPGGAAAATAKSASWRPLVEKLDAANQDGKAGLVTVLLTLVEPLVLQSADNTPADEDYALPVLQAAHQLIGDFAGERTILERRRALAAAKDGPQSYAAAILAIEFADLQRREGHPAEGEAQLRSAVAAATDASVKIRLQGALAEYLDQAQHLADAVVAYRALLDLQLKEKGPDSDDVFKTVQTLSWDLGQQGRHAEALALLDTTIPRAEAAWRATGADETRNGSFESLGAAMRYANLLERKGDHLGAQGKLSPSEFYFAEALKLRDRYFSGPTDFLAGTYNNMAFRENFEGQHGMAEFHARKALEIFEKVFDQTDVSQDLTYAKYKYNLASALLGLGKASDAVPLLRFGVPIQRKLGPDHPDLVILLTTLSRAIVASGGDLDEALSLSREAAAIARKHRAARLAGGYADSAPDPTTAALTRALAGDATTHDPLSMAYGALMFAASAAVSTDGRSDREALRSEMFMAAQDLEQSSAGQAMAEAAARAMAGTGPLGTLIARKQQLTDRARALNLAVTASVIGGKDAGLEEKRAALTQVAQELAAADAEIGKSFPDFAALVSPAALPLDEVKARLGPDEALVLIVPNGGDYYSFAVTHDTSQIHVIEGASEPVAQLVARVRCRLDEAGCTSAADLDPTYDQGGELKGIDAFFPRFDRRAAYQLYANLFEPLEATLAGKKRVFVTVAGPLGGLPLPTLITRFDGEKDDPEAADVDTLKNAAWLGDKYAFITLPSVAALRAARPLPKPDKPADAFIGYGAPSLQGTAGAARSVEQGGRRTMRSGLQGLDSVSPDALRRLAPLPGTEVELKRMAEALKVPASDLRLGQTATEAALKADPRLGSARIIAFATHGLLPREGGRSGEPGLVFTPPAVATPDDDGLLTASEASRLPLHADWVILSACNTAASDGTPDAQSLSGLGRAFLQAGARALLASHWRVSDEVTAVLTVETLRLSSKGLPKAEALREAMMAVRTGKRADGTTLPGWKDFWAHPAAWSPFVLVAADGG